MKDPFSADSPAFNIAYWTFVNYDPEVVSLSPLEPLPPLVSCGRYHRVYQNFSFVADIIVVISFIGYSRLVMLPFNITCVGS